MCVSGLVTSDLLLRIAQSEAAEKKDEAALASSSSSSALSASKSQEMSGGDDGDNAAVVIIDSEMMVEDDDGSAVANDLEDTEDEFQVDEEVTQSDARPKPWRARPQWRDTVRDALGAVLRSDKADAILRRSQRRCVF